MYINPSKQFWFTSKGKLPEKYIIRNRYSAKSVYKLVMYKCNMVLLLAGNAKSYMAVFEDLCFFT